MEQNSSHKYMVPVMTEQPYVVTPPPPGVVTASSPGPHYSQQTVVVTQAAPPPVNTGGYIAYACCVFLFCNWPMGLIAFIFAMMAYGQASSGNVDKAKSHGMASVWISTAGIVMTVVLIIILVALRATIYSG